MPAAVAALQTAGYRRHVKDTRPVELQADREGEIQRAGAQPGQGLVELHYGVFAGEWLHRTAAVDSAGVAGRAEPVTVAGRRAATLPPEDAVIQLAVHLAVNPHIPSWAGLETEIGEIKGKEGLSTPDEALYLIQGLNAHGIAADWIALNNGTTHGIEASDAGIQVDLTAEIHKVLEPYHVSGAQHGTSGNNSDRLREIAARTHTTKANVATALQMISWGLEVNDYGNAQLDADGGFIKVEGEGCLLYTSPSPRDS